MGAVESKPLLLGKVGVADGETTERDPNPPRRVERPGRLRREGAVPGWLTTAPTEKELAEQIGVAVDGFADTVARWNAMCADDD